MLDALARRYGARPSDVLRVNDCWAGFLLDAHCALVGYQHDAEMMRQAAAAANRGR